MTKFTFGLPYQKKILALMVQDYGFCNYATSMLEAGYFDSDVLVWYFVTIRNYFVNYGLRPTREVIQSEVEKEFKKKRSKFTKKKHFQTFKKVYKSLWYRIASRDYLIDLLSEFVNRQLIKNAAYETALMLDKEKATTEIIEFWRETLNNTSRSQIDLGTQYLKDYRDRVLLRDKEVPVIPTGIPVVDEHLKRGGLSAKQLGLILAAPGRGKTMALQHIIKASTIRRKKVAAYTLEMSELEYCERLDTSITGVSISSHNADLGKLFRRLSKVSRASGNSLIIKEFPAYSASIQDIEAHLSMLENNLQFVPDVVIVDYAELLRPSTKRSDRRFEIGECVLDLRALATRRNIPVWSAVQANRESLSKKNVTIKDLSESFEVAKHADLILAICQTEEEYENEIARIFFAKNRYKRDKFSVSIRTAYERAQFAAQGY